MRGIALLFLTQHPVLNWITSLEYHSRRLYLTHKKRVTHVPDKERGPPKCLRVQRIPSLVPATNPIKIDRSKRRLGEASQPPFLTKLRGDIGNIC